MPMNSKMPIFKEVAGALSGQIRERSFAPGAALPSENELCRQYNISRFSVRKALSLLEAEGLIVRQPGIGSIVCESANGAPAPRLLHIGITGVEAGNAYADVIYSGAGGACNECGARLVFTSCEDFIARHGEDIDGFIQLPREEPFTVWEKLDSLAASGKPVVFFNRVTDLPHLAYAAVDYELESRRAVEFLFRLGRRRVGLLCCDTASRYANTTRSRGYRAACEAAGVAELTCLLPEQVIESIDHVERFLDSEHPDALFVTCRDLLDYALIARRNCGLPELPVFCFDRVERRSRRENVMFVDMPLAEMAAQAVQYIADKCRGREPVPVMRQLFGTDFVFNSSIR